jgi:hypothetical protein
VKVQGKVKTNKSYTSKKLHEHSKQLANIPRKRLCAIREHESDIKPIDTVPTEVQCSCNSEVVETLVKNVLIPQLPSGSIVVMDNARFHNPQRLKEL